MASSDKHAWLVSASPIDPNADFFAIWPDPRDNEAQRAVGQQFHVTHLFAAHPVWIECQFDLGNQAVALQAPPAGIGHIAVECSKSGVVGGIGLPGGVARQSFAIAPADGGTKPAISRQDNDPFGIFSITFQKLGPVVLARTAIHKQPGSGNIFR
jgi:hypothetical protein